MKRQSTSSRSSSWLWAFQIAVGCVCIILSIVVVFHGATTTAGAYIWLFLAGIGLMILGAERLVSGLRAKGVKRSSRIINIAVGAGLIIYIGSGFFFPQIATKWLIIFLGFGLLANGVIRIVASLKKKEGEPIDHSSLGMGIIITSLSILILAYPKLGLAFLLVMTAVALAVSGVQIIIAGIRSRRRALYSQKHPGDVLLSKPAAVGEQEPSAKGRKGIWKNGTWFMDEHARYTLFRGVNFASRSKLPPYLPIAPLDVKDLSQLDLKKEIESVIPELDLLKKLGFNIVRLLISWKAIEPRPNPNLEELLPEGRQYLVSMKEIIDELYARNIYVILDFHQDIANEAYGGDGFPDWALAIDKEHERPKASHPDKKWQIKYMLNKSLKQTFKSFWENNLTNLEESLENFPVRTHLEKTIGQTVKFFKSLNNGQGHPAVLGVEPFNEPHPNTIPKKDFEAKFLMDFYRNVNSEIRKVDENLFIFIEPRVDWTMSSDGPMSYGASPLAVKESFKMDFIKKVMVDKKLDSIKLITYLPDDPSSMSDFSSNGVLAFHYYDALAVASSFVAIPESLYTYKVEFPAIFAQLLKAATDRGLVPFLTEFGAFQEAEQVREYLDLQYMQIERFLLNATLWNYDLYNTEEGKDNWNFENYSLLGPNRKLRNANVVARPFPMRSSAEPSLIFFDVDSKYASIILKGKVISDEPTIIYIPFDIHYSPEFTVWATSNELKWDKESQLLYWYPSKDQPYNQLIIGKGNKLSTEVLPDQSKELASKTTFSNTFS